MAVVVDFVQTAKLVLWVTTAILFVVGCLHSRTRVARVNRVNIALSSNKQTRASTAQPGDTHQLAKAHARFATRIVTWKVAPDANDASQDAVQLDM